MLKPDRLENLKRWLFGAFLLITIVVYLIVPFDAVRWSELPYPGFTLGPNLVLSNSVTNTTPYPDGTLPLNYPERLTAVDGLSLTTNQQFYDYLARKAPGDTITLLAEQPHNSLVISTSEIPSRSITVPLVAYGAGRFWSQFWLYYFMGIFGLFLGVAVLWYRLDDPIAQKFYLYTTGSALCLGLVFDQQTTAHFLHFWLFGIAFLSAFNFSLALSFPRPLWPKQSWLGQAIYIPSVIFFFWLEAWLNSPDPWAFYWINNFVSLYFSLFSMFSLAIVVYHGFFSTSSLVRQQGRLVLLGAFLGFLPLLLYMAKVILRLPGMDWLRPEVFVPAIVLYPAAIGYVIARSRSVDLNMMAQQGLSFGVVSFVLVGLLTLIFSGLSLVLEFDSPLVLALVVFSLTLFLIPVRLWLQRGMDQYLLREPTRFNVLLRRYNRELTTAVDTSQVLEMMNQYIANAIPEAVAHIYLLDQEMESYSQSNGDANSPVWYPDSPLIQVLAKQHVPIDLADELSWPVELLPHKDLLHSWQTALIAPLTKGEELLGWINFLPKSNGRSYTPSEINYLAALADQSLIALERANVVKRLEVRVKELDMLAQFSQALNYTIVLDDLLELIFINYQRLLDIPNFFVALRSTASQHVYWAFYLENEERYNNREGITQLVDDPRIHEVVNTGQMLSGKDNDGRIWLIAPLNAGAATLGSLYTYYPTAQRRLRQKEQQLFSLFADRAAIAIDRLQTQTQLSVRAQELESINQITLSLTSTLDLGKLLELILDKAIELLNTEAGTFMLMTEDTGELEFRVARGPASQNLVGKRLPVGTGLAGTVAQTGRPVLVNHAQEDKRWFANVDARTEFQTRSILTVPLLRQGVVLGVLQVINKNNGAPFDEDDQRLLTAFAGQATVALENARLLAQTDQALEQRITELYMLQQLDRDLNAILDVEQVLNITLDSALRICNGTAGAILLVNDEGHATLPVVRGYDDTFVGRLGSDRAFSGGIVGQVIETGKPHVTGNVHEIEGYVPASYNTHSQLTLPILHKQKTLGAIAIESDRFNAFDPYITETAIRITNHASVAIANALLYEQVNDANQAKSEFVSMVSHELKTPMTSMKGYTELMLSGMTGTINDQQRRFLETIAVNIKRMTNQIQDLTDISRIETGRLRTIFAATAFANIISDTLPSIQAQYDEKGTELTIDLPPDLPLVWGDKERLVQVMTNLLSNACKYSPAKTQVQVRLWAENKIIKPDMSPVPMVFCAVQDSGYGISQEDQRQLFTKFFRSPDPNVRKSAGTGLGLSITKGIVELHNGRIWVESELGKSTTFFFCIPQASPHQDKSSD